MSRDAQCPVRSRWLFNDENKGRVFEVIERHPFGKVTIKQEDRAYFGTMRQKDLLANATRLPNDASEGASSGAANSGNL